MTTEEFEALARRYGDTIFRVACHALGNRPDAEDVSQTVLMKLYCSQQTFDGPDHVKHWLLRVTVNECRRALRSPWRRRALPLEDYDAPVPGPDAGEESQVLAAVMALAPKYRTAVYLYYYEDCTVAEVARAMEAKESTVQTWLQRAREKLRCALSEPSEEGQGYVRP